MTSSAQEQPQRQPQAAPPPFHVRSARELFEALESPDGAIRLAALQAVQQAPETALSFGLYSRRDLVDVLLSQAERFRGDLEWLNWVGVLAAFHNPRVVELFTTLITTESHSELLFALANYLRTEPLHSISVQLRAALIQNACVARSRAVAPILARYPHLSPAEALRTRLLAPLENAPLLAFSQAIEEWLNELAGPFQLEARLELRRQGATTLHALIGHWDRLQESTRKWLLDWAGEVDADLVLDPIRKVIAERSEELLLAALQAAANLKEFPSDLEGSVIALLEHNDELVRRSAVMTCRSGLNWRLVFENETSVPVKQACLAKALDQESSKDLPFVLHQLANPDWRIRAAATEGLLSLGKSGIQAAFNLLPQADESARIAIARMVAHSADEDMLNEFLQSCPQAVSAQSANPSSEPHPPGGSS